MELVQDLLISALAVTVLYHHGWAGKGHFQSETMPRGAILILVVALMTGLMFLFLTWTTPQPLLAWLPGVAAMVFAWWLFWRAIAASRGGGLRLAFDEAGPRSLVVEGPYRYVRHPFYVSYVIFWAGWTLALWSWVALLPFAIVVAVYVTAARMEERKFAATPMAASYDAYRASTGFFWPKISNLR
jgi:protein-S-isoprenylcysteine O-methyltransferase Ste14